MKAIKRWTRSRPGPLVTVCWLDEGVTLAYWEGRPGPGRACRTTLRCPASQADAEGYLAALRQLVPGGRLQAVRVHWILIEESWPALPAEANPPGDIPLALPDWMRYCWESLPAAALPDRVLSGMALLQATVLDWPTMAKTGSGTFLEAGGRCLFVGHAEERPYRRVSRQDLLQPANGRETLVEWLLQTRLLFRNRTGIDLTRIYLSTADQAALARQAGLPMEVLQVPVSLTRFWGAVDLPARGAPSLHACAAQRPPSLEGVRYYDGLEKRKRWRRWEQRLKLGTGLLMGGWGLMLLGACRHDQLPVAPEGPALAGLAPYRSALSARQAAWRDASRMRDRQSAPFRLIGAVAGSLPSGVEVHRLAVSPDSPATTGPLRLAVEGSLRGEETSRVFRDWVEGLPRVASLEAVENLRFRRDGTRITFSLEGLSSMGGSRP